jgi:hypothetical protein
MEQRDLKPIGQQWCQQYMTNVSLFIEPPNSPGPRKGSSVRHLIARYEEGARHDLPMIDGQAEFAAGIPDEWSDDDVVKFISMGNSKGHYPIWEIPARVYASPILTWPDKWSAA